MKKPRGLKRGVVILLVGVACLLWMASQRSNSPPMNFKLHPWSCELEYQVVDDNGVPIEEDPTRHPVDDEIEAIFKEHGFQVYTATTPTAAEQVDGNRGWRAGHDYGHTHDEYASPILRGPWSEVEAVQRLGQRLLQLKKFSIGRHCALHVSVDGTCLKRGDSALGMLNLIAVWEKIMRDLGPTNLEQCAASVTEEKFWDKIRFYQGPKVLDGSEVSTCIYAIWSETAAAPNWGLTLQ